MSDESSGDPGSGPEASWDERRLCPDGGCLGVIGSDGACNVCGKVDPDAPKGGAVRIAKADGDDGDDGDDDGDDGDEEDGDDDVASDDDENDDGDEWQRRRLCEDGACIGVVTGGRCSTCGKQQ